MKKKVHYYLFVLSLLTILVSCSNDVFDDYYARPEGLEDPIFQQLEARGNFKSLTTLIGKAGYKDILSKSGYWTMMAPNDEAFTKYFQENGISDVSKVDSITAAKIVKFALIYNAFKIDRLPDYQSSKGWVEDAAFRRRTAFYDGYVNKVINGQPRVIIGSNRNGGVYAIGDNNNKYVTYFTEGYFASKGLSAYDFNYFYPTKEYTGFNVLDSKVVEADIIAENGVIHEVDQVSLPLLNIDQYLEQNDKYSLFHKMMEDNLVQYVTLEPVTTAYRNYTGKSDDVYVKFYDATLVFSPNNENYVKLEDNDGQADAYTLIAPENAPLQEFVNKVLLKNYSSIEMLPRYVFQDLANAHMVLGAVWPSQSDLLNGLGEDLLFDFNTDILDKKVLSNGIFYGANKVQKSNLFYTVYTSAYLDPKYNFATKIFNDPDSGYKAIISDIKNKYALLLPSDAVLISLGFDYDTRYLRWQYINPLTQQAEYGAAARNRLFRLFYNCIVPTPNGELDNIATTSGVIRTGDNELPGEYIKWSNNKVYAAGDVALGTAVNVIGKETQENGITYYVDKFPDFSIELQGLAIKRLAESNPEFNGFYQYLKFSTIFTEATGKIEGVDLGTSYTFVVPNQAAITRAIAAGLLPASSNPALQGEKDMVADFIRYHILTNVTASSDGLVTGLRETLRKDSQGDKTYIDIISVPGTLSFKDNSGSNNTLVNPPAKFIPSSSNNLADRSLIHLVDNYLKLTE